MSDGIANYYGRTTIDKTPCITPVKPPIENWKMNASTKSIGVESSIDPLYRVAVQLKTLIALGIATIIVSNEKINCPVLLIPAVNI